MERFRPIHAGGVASDGKRIPQICGWGLFRGGEGHQVGFLQSMHAPETLIPPRHFVMLEKGQRCPVARGFYDGEAREAAAIMPLPWPMGSTW